MKLTHSSKLLLLLPFGAARNTRSNLQRALCCCCCCFCKRKWLLGAAELAYSRVFVAFSSSIACFALLRMHFATAPRRVHERVGRQSCEHAHSTRIIEGSLLLGKSFVSVVETRQSLVASASAHALALQIVESVLRKADAVLTTNSPAGQVRAPKSRPAPSRALDQFRKYHFWCARPLARSA